MKFALLILATLSFATSALAQKSVLMMVPNDFMWPEYEIPAKRYAAEGYTVKIAGLHPEPLKPDRRNAAAYPQSHALTPDLTFDQVQVESFDAITFVAGNGAWHDFFPSESAHRVVAAAFAQNKVVGLLCASTGLLGLVSNWDGTTPIAAGRKAVGYFRVEGILRQLGKVDFVPGARNEVTVIVDGNLVTGRNPESSELFAEKVVETLKAR